MGVNGPRLKNSAQRIWSDHVGMGVGRRLRVVHLADDGSSAYTSEAEAGREDLGETIGENRMARLIEIPDRGRSLTAIAQLAIGVLLQNENVVAATQLRRVPYGARRSRVRPLGFWKVGMTGSILGAYRLILASTSRCDQTVIVARAGNTARASNILNTSRRERRWATRSE